MSQQINMLSLINNLEETLNQLKKMSIDNKLSVEIGEGSGYGDFCGGFTLKVSEDKDEEVTCIQLTILDEEDFDEDDEDFDDE